MKVFISTINKDLDLNQINLLTPNRIAKINNFAKYEDKARCMVTGLLLKNVLGINDDAQLIYGEKNKPYLVYNNVFFNISHSGEYVVLAISSNECGVDIEKIENYNEKVAERYFTADEYQHLKKINQNDLFYRMWTAKEAIMKAVGLGISMIPNSFSVLPMNSDPHIIHNRVWFLDWMNYQDYIIACANENAYEKIELVKI